MATAVEERDVATFMRHIADAYSDDDGNDAESLRGVLLYWMRRSDDVRVTQRIAELEVDGERATTRLYAGVADGPITSTDRRSDVMEFRVEWLRDDGRWTARRVRSRSASAAQLIGL